MNYQKDTSISPTHQDSKKTSVFQLFQKDSYLIFIYKKSERIISAFYLVSNLFPDSEPLKWQFRTIGIAVISHNLSLTLNPLYKSEGFYQLATELVKLLSLLDISHLAGLISEMNFIILKKELENLLETLNMKIVHKTAPASKDDLFGQEFFAVSPADPDSSVPDSKQGNQSESGSQFWTGTNLRAGGIHKGHFKGHKYIKDRKQKTAKGLDDVKGGGTRQNSIVELLKVKSNLTIRDFIAIIKDCSPKTIQRELSKLVKLGVLKREGERRWSHYSMASV